MATPPPPIDLQVVFSESNRIINAHSRHFLALSVLFLLPNSFLISVYPTIYGYLTDQSDVLEYRTLVLVLIAYIVIVTVFNILAIGSITYSVFQGFYERPVSLTSAVKSSLSSFFPLLATPISTNFILYGIPIILAFFTILFSKVWGLRPLKRSKSLIKGMRRVSLSIIFFFAVTQVTLGYISRASARIYKNTENGQTNVFFVVRMVITSVFHTLLTLYNIAAITVMYMYCKAWEIAQESAREYVSLPFDDDGKVYNNV